MRTKTTTLLTLALLGISTISQAGVTPKAKPAVTTPTVATSASTAKNPQLRQDLMTLINTSREMEADIHNKQLDMEKKYQPKVAAAKTDEQKQALQTQFLTDVVAYKKSQKQKLQAIKLTEPRVNNLRNTVVATLDSDIESAQIVINNPNPTPESQKKFVDAITNSENLAKQSHDDLIKLMNEAGISQDELKAKN